MGLGNFHDSGHSCNVQHYASRARSGLLPQTATRSGSRDKAVALILRFSMNSVSSAS